MKNSKIKQFIEIETEIVEAETEKLQEAMKVESKSTGELMKIVEGANFNKGRLSILKEMLVLVK